MATEELTHDPSDLTEKEMQLLFFISQLGQGMMELPEWRPGEQADFHGALAQCQSIILARPTARRLQEAELAEARKAEIVTPDRTVLRPN